MPRLSHAQEQARRRILSLAGRGLAPAPLGQAIVAAITEAIPADVQTLFGVDPNSLLYNRTLVASDGYVATRLNWLRNTYLVDQPGDFNHPAMMRARLHAAMFRDRLDECWGFPEQMRAAFSAQEWRHRYNDPQTPPGGVLMGCFAAAGQWIGALNLARLDARRPFQPTDVSFLRLVAPVIGRAMRAALMRERALGADTDAIGSDGAEIGPGVLLVDEQGRVPFATDAAEKWIALLSESWQPDVPGAVRLPTAVWAAVARARAGAGSGHVARVPTPTGTLQIDAAPGRDARTIAVVLTPERPPEPPALPADWPLTPRERAVLALVAHGRSNRQLSGALCVTENTVESHLAHAYGKLGVRSRAEFLARLFRETQLGAVMADAAASDVPDATDGTLRVR